MPARRLMGVLVAVTAALAAGCGTPGGASETAAEPVVIRAQARAPYNQHVENLKIAADRLNERYRAEGRALTVKVETDLYNGNWDEYLRSFILSFQARKAPDIWVTRHYEMGWLAKSGFIIPLDDAIDSGAAVYDDVRPGLWETVTHAGQRWAIPQDLEIRVLFYRKDLLSQLGWTEAQVAGLPARVGSGEFTLRDLERVGRDAVSSGLVTTGISHRPNDGPEFTMLQHGFGARLLNEQRDKLVLDKQPTLRFFQWVASAADGQAVSRANTQTDATNVARSFVSGKTLFHLGGAHEWHEWLKNSFHDQLGQVDEAFLLNNVGIMLVPAADAGQEAYSLAHPLVYVINSQFKRPDVAKDLLREVTSADLQAEYAVATGQLPVLKSVADHPLYRQAAYLQMVEPLLAHSLSMPNHPDFLKYRSAVYKSFQAVESGQLSPDQALAGLEQQLRADIGDQLIILP